MLAPNGFSSRPRPLLAQPCHHTRRAHPGPGAHQALASQVLAVSGQGARVRLEECLLARVTGNAIGALGYGVFAWKQAQVQVVDSDFQELKARRPPPSPASLARIARPRPGWPRRAGR